MFISKTMIDDLSAPFRNEKSVICYAKSQTLSGPSDKVILIMDDKVLTLLFLNITVSKVIHTQEIKLIDISHEKITEPLLSLDISWHFYEDKSKWRFRIMKKIVTLGNWQVQFINELTKKKS